MIELNKLGKHSKGDMWGVFIDSELCASFYNKGWAEYFIDKIKEDMPNGKGSLTNEELLEWVDQLS